MAPRFLGDCYHFTDLLAPVQAVAFVERLAGLRRRSDRLALTRFALVAYFPAPLFSCDGSALIVFS
jgi:hypothetical protein